MYGRSIRRKPCLDEHDLAGFIDNNPRISQIPVQPDVPVPSESENEETATETAAEPSHRSGANPIPIILIFLAVGGAAYYFKIYRPKKNAGMDTYDGEDESYDEDYDGGEELPDED